MYFYIIQYNLIFVNKKVNLPKNNKKLLFFDKKLLTNENLCGIILSSNQNRFFGGCYVE